MLWGWFTVISHYDFLVRGHFLDKNVTQIHEGLNRCEVKILNLRAQVGVDPEDGVLCTQFLGRTHLGPKLPVVSIEEENEWIRRV